MTDKPRRLSIFPLGPVVLFPRMHLPLHIFEPRYRALVADAMARDQRIGMIQPRARGHAPPLYEVGCIGKISEVRALDDGRFHILLLGESRFRILRELDVTTPFRQVEAAVMPEEEDDPGVLAAVERAALENEARAYALRQGYTVDWDGVARLDDETFVNAIAQVVPFDIPAKQALLETDQLGQRSELLIQLMQFQGRRDDPGAGTMQ